MFDRTKETHEQRCERELDKHRKRIQQQESEKGLWAARHQGRNTARDDAIKEWKAEQASQLKKHT